MYGDGIWRQLCFFGQSVLEELQLCLGLFGGGGEGGGIRIRRECKIRFLEYDLKEMGLCSLRKDRYVGNESRFEYMISWLKVEFDLFFMILGLERYD